MAHALGAVSFASADMAKALLTNMHDRHVGITPTLAVDFAKLVCEPRAPMSLESPWSRVFERLTAELRPQRNNRHLWQSTGRQRVGMLLSASPFFSVLGIAQPVVGLAIQSVGRNLLFCADAVGADVEDSHYEDYDARMKEAFTNLANSDDPKMELFWRSRALAMAGLSRESLPGKAVTHHVPRVDGVTLSLIENARPAVILPAAPKHQPRRQPNARTFSRIHKLKEGGIDGIRISRRPEDISSMLFSEYVRPKPIQADRLLNSGFLVTRREPRFEALRDVMVVALVAGELNTPLHMPLVKLAFFELALRLGFMLRRQSLNNTVFRWVEGHPLSGQRDMAFHLDALPKQEQGELGGSPDEFFRHQFLTTMDWLPRFADVHAPYERDHRGAFAALSELGEGRAAWLRRAWKGLPQAKYEPPALAAERFSYVHILLLAPEAYRYKERALNLVAARSLLGLRDSSRESISLTVIPQKMEDVTAWRFQSRDGYHLKTLVSEAEAGDITAMAGRLTTVWLNSLLREIWRG